MTGSPDGPPTKAIGGLADTGAGLHTAIGILAAIVQRQATGVGQQVEVAQQDSVVNLLRIHLRETYATGKPAPRQGNRSAAAAPSNIYRCRPAQRLRLHPLRHRRDVENAGADRRPPRAGRRPPLR
jgi:formyl-CoA transferase